MIQQENENIALNFTSLTIDENTYFLGYQQQSARNPYIKLCLLISLQIIKI